MNQSANACGQQAQQVLDTMPADQRLALLEHQLKELAAGQEAIRFRYSAMEFAIRVPGIEAAEVVSTAKAIEKYLKGSSQEP